MLRIKLVIVCLLSFIFLSSLLPAINAIGCNAIFKIDEAPLRIIGRCEGGYVKMVVDNSYTNDAYTISGRIFVIGKHFFIIPIKLDFIKLSPTILDAQKRLEYQRGIISGVIVKDKLIMTYTPKASMGYVEIDGRMAFFW